MLLAAFTVVTGKAPDVEVLDAAPRVGGSCAWGLSENRQLTFFGQPPIQRLNRHACGISAAPLIEQAKAQPLTQHGEIGNGRKDESRGDKITSTDRGTAQSYLLRRITRDQPELLHNAPRR